MAFNDSLKNLLQVVKEAQTAALALKAPLASPEFTGTPKAPTASAGSNDTTVATTAFVTAAINTIAGSLATALTFKGVVDKAADLPADNTVGAVYVVGIAGTYAGEACEAGDFIFCTAVAENVATYKVVQKNIDGAVTGPASAVADEVAVFDGATGKVIKSSGKTLGASVPADAKFTDTTYSAGSNVSINASNVISATVGVTKVEAGDVANQIKVTTNGAASAVEINNVANAGAATNDAKGNAITGYVKSLSISGKTITVTDGAGNTSTLTTQDSVAGSMKGATASAAGTAGLAPAPAAGAQGKVLTGAATYQAVEDLMEEISKDTIQGWWDAI